VWATRKVLGTIDAGYIQDPTLQWGHAASPILYESTVKLFSL